MRSLSEGIYAKVERATDHLNALKSEIAQFCELNAHEVRHEADFQAGEKTLVYYARENIPLRWSIVIGEIIHNLRSALDQAVYDLTIRESGQAVELSEFPIFADKNAFLRTTRGGGLYKIRGVGEKTKRVIEELQPFNIRKEGTESVLWLLHELSNIDKHRTIHLCRRMTSNVEIGVVRDITFIGNFTWLAPLGLLEDRTILARWKPTDNLGDEVDMNAKIAFDVAFGQGTVASLVGKSVTDVCERLIRGIGRVFHYLEESVN